MGRGTARHRMCHVVDFDVVVNFHNEYEKQIISECGYSDSPFQTNTANYSFKFLAYCQILIH